jgi:glycosyltransferase involved in cell wall biosynthesis
VKVAVYNRFWATGGGGEKYAASLAQALAPVHDVHLLSYSPTDWPALEERLGLELRGVEARTIDDDGAGSLARATADYDLLVNCSWMSSEASGARHGMYVVLFPTPFDQDRTWKQRAGTRVLGSFVRGEATLEWGRGFFPPEAGRVRPFRWTSDAAYLHVAAPEGKPVPVRLVFGNRPLDAGPADVEVTASGETAARVTVGTDAHSFTARFELVGRGRDEPVVVGIHTPTFVPRELYGPGVADVRRLGIRLRDVVVGSRARALLRVRHPILAVPPVTLDFLETYPTLISISRFTQEFVHRLWRRESELLYPTVPPIDGSKAKDPLILSVGRFFDRRRGHSKKQLEMVRAFRRLVERGLRGWEYHLVGGCMPEHAVYLEQVRREAEGLPVFFHVDAPGAELRGLYARASMFWHATGLGESEKRHPHRFEHFGMSTVEAMSAGAVPIVLGRAGQREIVEDGVSGYHFSTPSGLVARTWAVAHDPSLRARLAEAARRRARDFGPRQFEIRARKIVDRVTREDVLAAARRA